MTACVRDLMLRDFIRVTPDEGLADVVQLMEMARVRALPVLHDGRLAGVVRHRDLALAALARARAGDAVDAASIAPFVRALEPLSPEAGLGEAARRMIGEALPCLPAVEAGRGVARVVGLITEGELLRAAYRPARVRSAP